MEADQPISIWFFVGLALLVNGALIFAAGIYELLRPPAHPVVLSQLHAGIWWGAILLGLGAFYGYRFAPGKGRTGQRGV